MSHYLQVCPSRLERLQIEITTWCNLKCAGCSRTIFKNQGQWADRHMSPALFARVIQSMPPAEAIVLQGIGEPTLHPQLAELVTLARQSGKYRAITFNTNALTHDIGYYEHLKGLGLNHLSVSVDSINPDIAEACRGGTKVGKLKEMVQAMHRRLGFNLTFSLVLSRLNLYDFPNTLVWLNGLGRAVLEIQPLMLYGERRPEFDVMLDQADVNIFHALRAAIAPRLTNLDVILSVALQPELKDCRCARPFKAPYVTVDGFLTPCCTVDSPELFKHTSVVGQSYAQAWATPAVSGWLERYIDTEPAICRGCTFNPQRS